MEDQETLHDTDHKRELCELCSLPQHTSKKGEPLKLQKNKKKKFTKKIGRMDYYCSRKTTKKKYSSWYRLESQIYSQKQYWNSGSSDSEEEFNIIISLVLDFLKEPIIIHIWNSNAF